MEKFLKANLFQILTVVATLIGAGYLTIYRLDLAEAKAAEQDETIKKLKDDLRVQLDIISTKLDRQAESLGNVQLDVAVICSETARIGGKNPLEVCRVSGGHR
jgi:hypothetical protein